MERARVRILTPLRHRDFRLLWAGMTVSLLGDGIFLVALPWQVYQLSDAPTAVAMVLISMSVPNIVFLLVGGVVSDRVDRRKVMMAADLLRGISVAVFGVLSLTGALQLWHAMGIAAVFGAGTAFFGPAFDAIVPELVPPEILTQANSLDQFVRPAAWRMLGPALGGWIIAAAGDQVGAAFLADAATFAVSVVCLLLMRARPARPEAEDAPSAWREIREGFDYVRSQTWLWGTLLAATFAYLAFLGPTEVLVPRIVKIDMGESAGALGLIFAMGGIGAMSAALFMGRREMPRRNMTFIYVVWTLSTLSLAGYGLARFPWQAMVACFAFNALEGAGTIVWMTTKQRLVPNRLLGRVSSLDWFISIGLLPVSLALAPLIAAAIGARATLVWSGVLGAAVTFAFLFLPGLRDVEGSEALLAVRGEEPEPEGAPTAAPTRGQVPPTLEDTWAFPSPGKPPAAPPAATNGQRPPRHDDRPTKEEQPAMDEDRAPTTIEPSSAPEGGTAGDPIVERHLGTLAALRAAIADWQAARVELQAEMQVLSAEEARLVQAGRILEHAQAAERAVTEQDLTPIRTIVSELSAVADADPRSAELAEHGSLVVGAAEQLERDLHRHREQAELAPAQLRETRERIRALRSVQDELERAPVSMPDETGPGSPGGTPEPTRETDPKGAKVAPPSGR
jgi:DHA3 family tetracycline resistance protein-like MFS transporter